MPTILRVAGFQVRIYTHDHFPPHVHFWHGSGVIVIYLNGENGDEPGILWVREVHDLKAQEQRRALRIAEVQRAFFWINGVKFMAIKNGQNPHALPDPSDAERRGLEADVREARAVAARYDEANGHLIVALRGGATLMVPVRLLQGVAGAPPELIAEVEITPGGSGLHWEKLDADLLVQGLAAGSFGTARWMRQLAESGALDAASLHRREMLKRLGGVTAGDMGRRGGSAKSEAKTSASRANGAKGGRPRKSELTTA